MRYDYSDAKVHETPSMPSVNPQMSTWRQRYPLNGRYAHVYFTQREAETALLVMEGHTMKKIAGVLCLSPRTVEFYIGRIKEKLSCRSKSELIGVLHRMHFSLYRERILACQRGENREMD